MSSSRKICEPGEQEGRGIEKFWKKTSMGFSFSFFFFLSFFFFFFFSVFLSLFLDTDFFPFCTNFLEWVGKQDPTKRGEREGNNHHHPNQRLVHMRSIFLWLFREGVWIKFLSVLQPTSTPKIALNMSATLNTPFVLQAVEKNTSSKNGKIFLMRRERLLGNNIENCV